MSESEASARLLFRSALLIFLVTIVIGILNGMDIWEPSHELLLTHVHAGTLGWITLAVFGAAMLVFGGEGSRNVAIFAVAATVLYVVAFATTTGVLRPIAGTLELVAIVWMLGWVWRQYGPSARSTGQLGVLLAMVSLTIGAILGVLLGLFIANGSIPGLSDDVARSLAGAHPPAMLIGYLVLAGAAIVHWLLAGPQTTPGRLVMWALFVGGMAANLAFILDIEALIQVATLFEVLAIITFTVHMWGQIKPSEWSGAGGDDFARMGSLFLLVGVGLLVYVVQLFISGEIDPETGTGPVRVVLAFDHALFIGVMTNALFAMVSRTTTRPSPSALIWLVNGGVVVFLVGLVADSDVLIQIGAPVMGLALIYGIYVFLTSMRPFAVEPMV
ncbi:MAG TPA: hypothetical protein VMM14_04030 [Acidimicrobiia bacterium]|nr:hypothetical protein [Acidimicrobiia bacterium]